jgi:Phosphate-selective porin O and P
MNRLRTILPLGCLLLLQVAAMAQIMKQSDSSIYQNDRIIPVDKAGLLKNMDVIFNIQYALNSNLQNGNYTGSNFALNQFRLEIKGQITDNVFFRFRDRYTRDPIPQTVDNTNHSVDMAFIQINLSRRWSVAFGKMSADYGGYEFEANPIYIYQYNDIIAHADDFLVGAQGSLNISKDHSLTVQLLNARTETFAEIYDTIPGVSAAKFPFAAVGNWRGSFAGGRFTTFWSYSVIKEAAHKYISYLALGNQFHSKKWLIQYDLKYNPEGIDRTSVVTGIVPASYSPYTALNTFYLEHWLHASFAIAPKWSTTIIAMTSDAFWYGNPDPNKNSHLRAAYGLIPSIEYYPLKKLNLKFFSAYVGRYYDYSGYAKSKFGSTNSTTGVFMIGFISPLVIL